jgi:hypothetical protein
MVCSLGCGREIVKIGKSGKGYCDLSPNRCPAKIERDKSKKKGINPFASRPHPRGAIGLIPWNKGQTKETSAKILEASTKISSANKGRKPVITDAARKKMSDAKKNLYLSGWEPVCGRCKKIEYNTKRNVIIKLDGSWELLVAKYLDFLDLNWTRNSQRFEYINLNNGKSTYCPDFWVEEWNSFLEVKGYETDLDRCKWQQFPKNLIIWKKDKIDEIRKILS